MCNESFKFNKSIQFCKKTKHLLVLDTSTSICSLSSEILSQIFRNCFRYLKSKPEILSLPHVPQPSSYGLTKNFYNDYIDIIKTVKKILGIKKEIKVKKNNKDFHDIPDSRFIGPF